MATRPRCLSSLMREQHPELVRAESRAERARRLDDTIGRLIEDFRSRGWWREQRRDHLVRHPLCARCRTAGRTTPAKVLDHIEPARVVVARAIAAGADGCAAFRDPRNLQGLCGPCDSAKQREERHGTTDGAV